MISYDVATLSQCKFNVTTLDISVDSTAELTKARTMAARWQVDICLSTSRDCDEVKATASRNCTRENKIKGQMQDILFQYILEKIFIIIAPVQVDLIGHVGGDH